MSKQELERIDDLGMAAWDNHKPDAFADLFADEFVLRDTTLPEPLHTVYEAVAYAPCGSRMARSPSSARTRTQPG